MDLETIVALDDVREGIRGAERRLDSRIAELRRHVDVVTESLRDDIRLLAAGFASLSTRIDRYFGGGAGR